MVKLKTNTVGTENREILTFGVSNLRGVYVDSPTDCKIVLRHVLPVRFLVLLLVLLAVQPLVRQEHCSRFSGEGLGT